MTPLSDQVRALQHVASDLLQHIDWLTHGLPEMLEAHALTDEEGLIGAAADAASTARAALASIDLDQIIAAVGKRPAVDARTVAADALQSACESDPADPDHPDTICITTGDFETIVHCAIENWLEMQSALRARERTGE